MKSFFLPVALLTCSAGYCQRPAAAPPKLRQMALTSSTVHFNQGLVDKESSQSTLAVYDDQGRPTLQVFAGLNGRKQTRYTYTYGTCPEYQRWVWVTEESGRVDTVQQQVQSFDQNCHATTVTWLDSTHHVTETRRLTYNQQGQQTGEYDTDPAGKVTARVQVTYPDSLTIDKQARLAGNVFWYHTRETRNQYGNVVHSLSFDQKGQPNEERRTLYEYADGRLVRETHAAANGQPSYVTTYAYNAAGFLAESTTRTADPERRLTSVSVYQYQPLPPR